MASSSIDWPVHQLWPLSGGKQKTELDVILFHGLQLTASDINDAWTSTWTQRGHDNVCWPQEWLPFDLGEDVRIFSVSYDVHVVTTPHDHVSEIADNLFQNLMDSRYKWQRPIILIGHSFGGLVLKSLVVKLEKESNVRCPSNDYSKARMRRAKLFLRNVRGVAFYAVPHAGSTNIPIYVNKLLRCKNKHHRGIMDNMKPCSRDINQLSVDFDRIVTKNVINIYAFCEGRAIEEVGILVEYSSAQQSAQYNCYKVEDANHMEVCKPPSKEHPSYALLLQFIKEVGRDCEQSVQEVHDIPQTTFGLESYLRRVETLVMSAGSDRAPKYVAVWGMGGVGKTLLLKTVYGSLKVRSHFQWAKFIWLTVGRTPDILALYQRLSEELGRKPKLNVTEDDYKLKLHSQFVRKEVFLVLDDVWEAKIFDSLDLAKGEGSVTLMSTRNGLLLDRASPDISKVRMIPLSEKDSWRLFCAHAFRNPSNIPHELEGLAQSMAEECKGLPLALKVIGRAICGKRKSELQWEPLLKKLRESCMQERTVEDDLYERLKLGYDLLLKDDWRLHHCFLYFAAYPEDYEILFEDILCVWIGEGLVPANGKVDPRADAYSLLTMLCKRSFIESNVDKNDEDDSYGDQDDYEPLRVDENDEDDDEDEDDYEPLRVDENDEDDDYEDEDDYKPLRFKIHDVMRDFAFYVLRKDCGISPAKELYIHRAGNNLEEVPEECTTIPEALRLSMSWNKLKSLPGSFCAPVLISLLLQGNPIVTLPASCWINFPKLRVLDLSRSVFDSLPEEIGNLESLVCLNCSVTNLQTLPHSIGRLQALKWLKLSSCPVLHYLPSTIVGLTALQVLMLNRCFNLIWAEQIPESLRQYVTVRASLADICNLVSLTKLSICGLHTVEVDLPHNISALTKLKDLRLNIPLKTFPPGMPFWLKELQILDLRGGKNLKYFPTSITLRGAFPNLLKLFVHAPSLVQFPVMQVESLPKLRTLFLNCPILQDNSSEWDLSASHAMVTIVTNSDVTERKLLVSPPS